MTKTLNINTTKLALSALVAAMVFGACASASAQTAGTWSASFGINDISPRGTTDPFSPPSIVNSTTKVQSDAQPVLEVSYNFTDHISAEFGIGTPYKHELDGAGSLQGAGKLGSLKQLPPTLFAQYHFLDPNAQVRPYVGVGLTYAIFRDETGNGTLTAITNPGSSTPTTFTVDNAWGWTPQVGVTFAFNSKWYADAMVGKTYISTTVHLSTGETASAPLNPLVGSFTIGYRF